MPRFNTLSMTPVSGNIISKNVNADISVACITNKLIATLQSGIDFEDTESEMNFLLMNVRYKIRLTRVLSISPFLAFYSEHKQRFIDEGSDANGGVFLTFEHSNFTLEGFVLIVRLTHERQMKEAFNRLEVKWKLRTMTLSGFVFHNTQYFDSDERICLGFRIMLPEIILYRGLRARTDITSSFKVYETPETSSLSGVFLSLAFPIRI
jgi:hypothetical protein